MCRQTYSQVRDAAQIYDIKTRILTTKQDYRFITEYSNILQNLWQELDHYKCIKMKCSENATIIKKFMEKDKIYIFFLDKMLNLTLLDWKKIPSIIE